MDKWEYKKSDNIEDLKKLGEEGWELCAVETVSLLGITTPPNIYYFKRKKE